MSFHPKPSSIPPLKNAMVYWFCYIKWLEEMINFIFMNIKGAKENNLKSIDVQFPENKLIVFTGLSGSGKSMLALETLQRECQRQYMESMGMTMDIGSKTFWWRGPEGGNEGGEIIIQGTPEDRLKEKRFQPTKSSRERAFR